MVLGSELFEEKALSFNHWEKEQCPHFTPAAGAWRSPWALSQPGVRSLWKVAGIRPWIHPQGTAQTGNGWLVEQHLPPFTSVLPLYGQRKTLLSVTRCEWNRPDGLPSNTKCSYSPRLGKTLKVSLRTGSTASSAGAKGGWTTELHVGNQRLAPLYPICETPSKNWDTAHSGKNHHWEQQNVIKTH